MSFELTRVNELSYMLSLDGYNNKIVLNFDRKSIINDDYEMLYNISEEFSKRILRNKDKGFIKNTLSIGDKKWKISQGEEKKSGILLKILKISYDHKRPVIQLNIEKIDSIDPIKSLLPSPDVKEKTSLLDEIQGLESKSQKKEIQDYNANHSYQSYKSERKKNPELLPCSREEFRNGIRGKSRLFPQEAKGFNQRSMASSGWTTLSSLAFQRYEKEYKGTDAFTPEKCRCCLILDENNVLALQKKSSKIEKQKTDNKRTVEAFFDAMKNEYGNKKIDDICYLYDIDYTTMIEQGDPLTPEHVFRLNIGVNDIEINDLENLQKKLPDWLENFEHTAGLFPDDDVEDIISKMKVNPLFNAEIRGLLRAVQNDYESLNPQNVAGWVRNLTQNDTISEMTPSDFNKLVSIYSIPNSDKQKMYTGREIFFPIKSGYTIAETGMYKPWIDELELLQTFTNLENTSDWESYYEKLSYVVCKKHLFRKHPESGYKVGAVIPAPMSIDGEKRWYCVKQALHNGYGKLVYLLEPVCQDSTLPTVKLYRSTSSDKYAAFGAKTIRTDLNPLNPPGYEGKNRTDHYENSVIKEHTIPVWVGYLEMGKRTELESMDDCKKTAAYLSKANETLYLSKSREVKTLSLREIISRHEPILNTMFLEREIDRSFYTELKNSYVTSDAFQLDSEGFQEKQKEDATKLVAQAARYKDEVIKNKSPHLQLQAISEINDLIDELTDNIITNQARTHELLQLEYFRKKTINKLLSYQNEVDAAIKSHDIGQAKESLNNWINALNEHAIENNEQLSEKKVNGLTMTGHSLGGAGSQIFTVYYLVDGLRVPVPNSNWNVFSFDAPGVNRADNQAFKEYLSRFNDLFENLDNRVSIYQQFESKSPFSGPGVPLGSAEDTQEAAVILSACNFEACVYTKHPDAKTLAIAFSDKVHGTQFHEGKEGIDFSKDQILPHELPSFSSDSRKTPKSEISPTRSSKSHWNYPIAPETIEGARSNLTRYYSPNLLTSNDWPGDDPNMIRYLDPEGNFVVDEKGVVY